MQIGKEETEWSLFADDTIICIEKLNQKFFFCGTGVRTQGLHVEPLHHPFFCDGFF
jgi:hypothetical protein